MTVLDKIKAFSNDNLSSVFSARFMNCYGLTLKEFIDLLSQLEKAIKEARRVIWVLK